MTGPVLIGVGIVNILFGFSDSVAASLRAVQSQRDLTGHCSFPADGEKLWPVVFENENGTLVAIARSGAHIGGSPRRC